MYEERSVKNCMVWYGYREILHKCGLVNARRPILRECVKLCEDFLLCTDMEKNFVLNNCDVNLVAKTVYRHGEILYLYLIIVMLI